MVNLNDCTVVELRKKAKNKGIPYYYDMRKDELIRALRRKRSSKRRSRKRSSKRSPKRSPPRLRKKDKWKIYTMRGCPYCTDAKALLRKHGETFSEVVVTDRNRTRIYNNIDNKTKSYRYFPIIFKNNRFLGGFGELEKFFS